MREVAVITGGDCKYSQAIKEHTAGNSNPTHSCPQHKQAAEVQESELSN